MYSDNHRNGFLHMDMLLLVVSLARHDDNALTRLSGIMKTSSYLTGESLMKTVYIFQ